MEREHTVIGDVLFYEFVLPTYGFDQVKFEQEMGIPFEDNETTWNLLHATSKDAKEIFTRDICMRLAKAFGTTVEFWENLRDM